MIPDNPTEAGTHTQNRARNQAYIKEYNKSRSTSRKKY